MNIHLPAILGFTRYQGFDPSPYQSRVPEFPKKPGGFSRDLVKWGVPGAMYLRVPWNILEAHGGGGVVPQLIILSKPCDSVKMESYIAVAM